MRKPRQRAGFVIAILALLTAVPLGVMASHSFTDVPDSNTFHSDIDWLANADVTRGCNPPDNTEFCPSDNVTREQMAAFMHRLADNEVVDAGWLNGMTAEEIIDAAATGQNGPVHAATADHADTADHAETAGTAENLEGYEPGEVARSTPDGDIYNYLVEMNKGDDAVDFAEIGPFTFTAKCEDDGGDTNGIVEYTSTVDWYEDASLQTAGTVLTPIDDSAASGSASYDYWYEEIAAPGPGVYLADDGYNHTVFLEHGDIDCVFAGTFFPHIRES